MISPDALGDLPVRFVLPANTPARASCPAGDQPQAWWSLGDRCWLADRIPRGISVLDASNEETARVGFSRDSLGFTSDPDEDWVWESSRTKGFMADILEGILADLDASVPHFPAQQAARLRPYRDLSWLDGARHNSLSEKRWRSAKRLEALRAFSAPLSGDAAGDTSIRTAEQTPLIARLRSKLEAIPRAADVTFEVSRLEGTDTCGVTWQQSGDMGVIWGADRLALTDSNRQVVISPRPEDERNACRKIATRAYLVSMALAFASVSGVVPTPVFFRFVSVDATRKLDAALVVRPGAWGFELPQLAHDLEHPPENTEFLFRDIVLMSTAE